METKIRREKLETGNRVAVWWWNLFSEAEILYKFGKFWPTSCGIISSDSLLEFWHLTFISGIHLIDWCHQNNIRPLLGCPVPLNLLDITNVFIIQTKRKPTSQYHPLLTQLPLPWSLQPNILKYTHYSNIFNDTFSPWPHYYVVIDLHIPSYQVMLPLVLM